MSWKRFLTAGLLCIIASPAFANPTLKITSGNLDSQGRYVWNVTIAATTGTSPVAAELGFTSSGPLSEVARGTAFTGANTQNPGTQIFNWEQPGVNSNGKPVGTQANCTGCTIPVVANTENGVVVNGTLNQIFSAMGSLADVPAADTNYLTIRSAQPNAAIPATLTSTITLSGKYGTGSANGRIAEITSGTTATNYNNFAGVATRVIKAGDINFDGVVDVSDVGILATNFGATSGKFWTTGDLDASGGVDVSDVGILATNFGQSGGSTSNLTIVGAPAAGASIGPVPEPASVVALALAGCMLACFGRSRRS